MSSQDGRRVKISIFLFKNQHSLGLMENTLNGRRLDPQQTRYHFNPGSNTKLLPPSPTFEIPGQDVASRLSRDINVVQMILERNSKFKDEDDVLKTNSSDKCIHTVKFDFQMPIGLSTDFNLRVKKVSDGGQSDLKGVRSGMVVLAVGGVVVSTVIQLQLAVRAVRQKQNCSIGTEWTVSFMCVEYE